MAWYELADVNLVDNRPGRTVPDAMLEAVHGVGFTFGLNFNSTIGEIAHPAVDAFACGRVLSEIPEPHSLHSTADHNVPRDAHAEMNARIIPGPRPGSGRPARIPSCLKQIEQDGFIEER